MHARFIILSFAALALQACDGALPVAPAPEESARQAAEAGARVIDRFDIELSADGALRPGQPIRLSARVTSALATPGARVELTLPDIEVERHIRRTGRPPAPGERIGAAASWEGSLGAGQSREIGTVVTIPEPGYYRIVATAAARPGDSGARHATSGQLFPGASPGGRTVARGAQPVAGARPGAPAVREVAVEELWLLIDDKLGATHGMRRLADLPEGVARAAGAFHRTRRQHFAPGSASVGSPLNISLTDPAAGPASRGKLPSISLTDPAAGSPSAPLGPTGNPRGWFQGSPRSSSEIAVSVRYYHPLERAFRHARGVPVTAQVWRREATGDRYIGRRRASSATDGGNLFPCSANDPDEYLLFRVELSSGALSMPGAGAPAEVVATSRECGLEYYFLESDAPHTHVFLNLTQAAAAARRIFSASRPPITVLVDPSPSASSGYALSRAGEERITIGVADVWDEYGTFVQAHEYGHAFHQHAWGGVVGGCLERHRIDQPSSLACAYTEGIASFFSFATMPATTVARNFSGITAMSGEDRSTTEVHVASFLVRLIDSATDPGRTWDRVQFPGSYVGETIRTCTTDGVSPARADGIDRLIYCLERRVEPIIRDAYFRSRVDASRITTQHSGVEAPAGWSRANVRTLWERVLYGQEWTHWPG